MQRYCYAVKVQVFQWLFYCCYIVEINDFDQHSRELGSIHMNKASIIYHGR